MSITRNSGHGTVTFHRLAAKADSSPAPEMRTKASGPIPARTIGERNVNRTQFTDPATLAFRERTAKAEAPRKVALSEAATEFAERSRISSDAVHLFATVATQYERTKEAPFDDSHELSKLAGLSAERTRAAKEELTRVGLINIRCNDQWGRDSLVPCRKFLDRAGRW